MRFIRKLGFLFALGAISLSTTAQADVICRGKPAYVVIDHSAFVNSDLGFGPLYFCNLDYEVTFPYVALKSSCPAILSQLMTAAASGKDVGLYFVGLSSCSNIRASNGWAVQQPAQVYFFP